MEKLKLFFKELNPLTLLLKFWDHIKENPGFWFSAILIGIIALILSNFAVLLFSEICFLVGWYRIFTGLDDFVHNPDEE